MQGITQFNRDWVANSPKCDCGSGEGVLYICMHGQCNNYKSQRTYCVACLEADKHVHSNVKIPNKFLEYNVEWEKLRGSI